MTPVESTVVTGENGRVIKSLQLAHRCKSQEELEIEAGFQEAADLAHKLEAERDALKAQIYQSDGDNSEQAIISVRELIDQMVAKVAEIKALQDKYNQGWKF